MVSHCPQSEIVTHLTNITLAGWLYNNCTAFKALELLCQTQYVVELPNHNANWYVYTQNRKSNT